MLEEPSLPTCPQNAKVDVLQIRASRTKCCKFGQLALKARRTLVADLSTNAKVDVMQIRASRTKCSKKAFIDDLTAIRKVDVLLIWATHTQ